MYGLVMLREYLVEILDEVKTFDARAYDTKKRGIYHMSKVLGKKYIINSVVVMVQNNVDNKEVLSNG